MKGILNFRIKFAKKDKRWVKVFIFADKELMFKFYQAQLKITGQEGFSDFRAMFQPYEIISIKKDSEVKKNKIGNLLLVSDDLGSGLISHECGHAALHYWRLSHKIVNIDSMEQEEELLHILGYLVADFWRNYFKNEKAISLL